MNLRQASLYLLLLAGIAGCTPPSEAQAQSEPQRLFTVSGRGEARQAPDIATISAGVRTQAATAAEALQANTTAMQGVFAAMRDVGIEDRDMQTSNFSVQPVYQQQPYDRPQTEPPRIIAYQVFNQVTVVVRDLSKLGGALDRFVTAGANELYGVAFGIAEQDPVLDRAREAAIKDAMRKAKLMTDAAGVDLGRLMSMSEASNWSPPMPMMARAEAAQSMDVPVGAGEQVLQADVTLTFEIK